MFTLYLHTKYHIYIYLLRIVLKTYAKCRLGMAAMTLYILQKELTTS